MGTFEIKDKYYYNKNEYFYFPNKNSSNEQSPRSEKKFDINIDIKRKEKSIFDSRLLLYKKRYISR